MDTTDSADLQQALSGQETLLRKHDDLLGTLMNNSVALARQVSDLTAQLANHTAQLAQLTPQPPSPPLVATPSAVTFPRAAASRDPHAVVR